jgi:hypothetical protein
MRRSLDRCVACRVMMNRERIRRIEKVARYKAITDAVNKGFVDLQAGLMLQAKPMALA